MRKNLFSTTCAILGFFSLLLVSATVLPLIVSAQTQTGSSNPTDQSAPVTSGQNFQLVPCQGAAGYNTDPTTATLNSNGTVNYAGNPSTPCDFEALILLVQRIINFAIYAAGIIATLSIVYAGFIYLTAGGDTGKTKKAKEIFKVTVIGFAIALCSWLVVYTVITAVINPNFNSIMFLKQQ